MIKAHNVMINRDKEWFKNILPKLRSFWNEVEYYREHEDLIKSYVEEQLQKKKDNKKNKKKKDNTFIKNYVNTDEDLFIDSDEIVKTTNINNDEDMFIDSDDNKYDDNEYDIDDKLFK